MDIYIRNRITRIFKALLFSLMALAPSLIIGDLISWLVELKTEQCNLTFTIRLITVFCVFCFIVLNSYSIIWKIFNTTARATLSAITAIIIFTSVVCVCFAILFSPKTYFNHTVVLLGIVSIIDSIFILNTLHSDITTLSTIGKRLSNPKAVKNRTFNWGSIAIKPPMNKLIIIPQILLLIIFVAPPCVFWGVIMGPKLEAITFFVAFSLLIYGSSIFWGIIKAKPRIYYSIFVSVILIFSIISSYICLLWWPQIIIVIATTITIIDMYISIYLLTKDIKQLKQ